MAGTPAKFIGIVKISFAYIVIGSSTFSPILKAGVGDVGPMMTSKSSNTLS
ncbi:hypothetical protein D3C79_1044530 [compost metagenome]